MEVIFTQLLSWMCNTFGHNPDISKAKVDKGDIHTVCKRCHKSMTTVNYDVIYGGIIKWKSDEV